MLSCEKLIRLHITCIYSISSFNVRLLLWTCNWDASCMLERKTQSNAVLLEAVRPCNRTKFLSLRVGGMSRQALECAAAGQCSCPPILGVTDHSLSSAGAESTVVASPRLIAVSLRHSVQCSTIQPLQRCALRGDGDPWEPYPLNNPPFPNAHCLAPCCGMCVFPYVFYHKRRRKRFYPASRYAGSCCPPQLLGPWPATENLAK